MNICKALSTGLATRKSSSAECLLHGWEVRRAGILGSSVEPWRGPLCADRSPHGEGVGRHCSNH